jgi:hypothetical protein
VDRDPDAGRIPRRGQDPVGGARGEEERIPLHQDDLALGDPEPRLSLQQQDPFILVLVIEDGLGKRAADDSLDAYRATTQQILENLSLGGPGDV